MKRFVFILILLGSFVLAFANPLPSLLINKFWIDDSGDLNVKYASSFLQQEGTFDLFDGTNHFVDEITFSNSASLVKVYPDAAVTALQGYFSVTSTLTGGEPAEVHWGQEIENDISSLSDGECGMRVYVSDGLDSAILMWVKELDIFESSEWWPFSHSNIDVTVLDSGGQPISDYPVYMWFPYSPWAVTAEDGHVVNEIYSTKLRLIVKHPDTQIAVCDSSFFAEPGQNYNFTIQFSSSAGEDPFIGIKLGQLSVYPSVMKLSSHQSLNISYSNKLTQPAVVELYDLKGRLLGKQDYVAGVLEWRLPNKLSSGVYFLRLNSGTTNLGSRKLILLK
ncbi:MAG: T9SS type A sorting domain-containing protein [Candidatus Cloacimonetes bacterium]|nr:T9SS type A sorting domain-containing protein [Candidatus Cloacimonadota bacterium]